MEKVMGSDMLVALKDASADGTTFFGLNHHAAAKQRLVLQIAHGQVHDTGAIIRLGDVRIPQARQTFSALGMQPAGHWGFVHGVNEHHVAVSVTSWRSRLEGGPAPLAGADLVRLALERSRSALLAVEVLTDLLERFGPRDGGGDYIYLIADAGEAFVLETSGRHWALLECGHTRVVTDAAMIRQDWRRLAPGFSDFVLKRGWWSDDGSKIDFVRCLAESGEQSGAQKRWGRASLALAQQQGAIDLHFLRHMLSEHYSTCRDLLPVAEPLAASFLVNLHRAETPTVAWIAFGTPKVAVHFPICMVGELPAAFGEGASTIQERTQELLKLAQGKEKDRNKLALALERLQTKFDQDADEFLLRAHDFLHHGKPYLISQLATEMMHHHVEHFEKEHCALFGIEQRGPHRNPATEELLFYA
jgi:secernin